jgi:dephospho-CoA kinase
MRVIGLTGGIGTGKSTVGRLITERFGVPVIDADQVSREVVAPGSPGLAAVVQAFGPDLLDGHGALDRARMRGLVMADPTARKRLEAILHPLIASGVRAHLDALRAAGHPVAVVEAALMVETGSYRAYDALLVVSASRAAQLARVQARDHQSVAEVERVLDAQLPLADKEAVATAVIHNDADLPALQRALDALWPRLAHGASEAQ